MGLTVVVCIAAGLTLGGCARHPAARVDVRLRGPDAPSAPQAPPVPRETLGTFIAKVRKIAADAAVARRPDRAATLESTDPDLAAALIAAKVAPTPATYRDVARAYARHGIIDTAHQYLNEALRMDPTDGATYEALARLWRDWRAPHLALGDAHRAVAYAPRSAPAHNTLGTVLQAIGRRREARKAYERTLELDPMAAYALNNLCYGWILDGQAEKAVAACKRALEIEPDLRAARNNLGLAHAASNDLDAARRVFSGAGDAAASYYNLGIVHLARREYPSAVRAFEAAQMLRPAFARAVVRARQAREMAKGGGEE